MGYIYAIIALIAFGVLGICYKIGDKLKCDKSQLNFFFMFTAMLIVMVWSIASRQFVPPKSAIILGTFMGIISLVTVIIFREAVAKGRISTSWTILNLALVLPVVASVFVWNELPKPHHYAGFALTVVAIILLGIDMGRAKEQ